MRYEPFVHNNETFLTIEKWQELDPTLKVGFSTRQGGISQGAFNSLNLGLHVSDKKAKVLNNREILAKNLSIPLNYWVSGAQVHGAQIKVVNQNQRGQGSIDISSSIPKVDGLITKDRNVLCTAFFADCVPLYFFDPQLGYIGIAHAGWRGTALGIAEVMVNKFRDLGVRVENLLVAIGPAISQTKYEVDRVVIEQIPQKYLNITNCLQQDNRFLLDLQQLNSEILLQSGILRHNISRTNYCTYSADDLFFSYRRDKGKTGRMLGFIGYSTNT